ncbi:MAG TPA: Gfo/Idh/MocA family oxidoreductase [Gaiellaceae bacterium]|jgi:predicted dehydrogenase|nr:Gfo/Idh/MocA family oxidoreductase [Gaiellaceae bacterium]
MRRRAGGDAPVRIGVVGLGYWGPNLVRVLHELSEAEVVVVCDADASKLDVVVSRYSRVRATVHYDDLLKSPDVEAIAIATPISTHAPLASAALRAGKHAFVEKPLAASVSEAEDLLSLARRTGRLLMPGHTFLYSPAVNTVADLIRGGDLGEIYFVSTSRVNLGLHQSDVSVIWDLAPHDFSILLYWLGELPEEISAAARGCVLPSVPDVAFMSMRFPSGTLAHVELSWLAPTKLRRTVVAGSKKMVVYEDTSPEPVRIFDSGVALPEPETFGEYKLTYRTGDIIAPAILPAEPLALELADFCRAIRGGAEPRSSAAFGVDVVRMVQAAHDALVPIRAAPAAASMRAQ